MDKNAFRPGGPGNETAATGKRRFLRAVAAGGLATLGVTGPRPAAAATPARQVAVLPTTEALLANGAPDRASTAQTLGFRVIGDGGGGVLHRMRMAQTREDFEGADGVWWRPVLEGGVANVRQFGAIGDGRHDDTAAIHRAGRALRDAGASVLFLPAGTYRVSGPVFRFDRAEHRNGLKVCGEGPAISRLILDGVLDGAQGDFLFKVTGGTTAYGAPHASWIDFEDFGINGNGSDRQDLFSFTCADRVNLRNLQAFNFRGYGVRGREWWDSLCDARFVRGGDDSLGAEKAVIDLDYVFADRIWDSSCNNIIFPETTQIESYRYQAMRMGTATRRVTFRGKIHYWIGKTYTQPAVHILGGVDNRFLGAAMTHAVGSDPRPRDITVENNGWIPARNVFQSSSMGGGIDFIGDCRQHLVKDNVFDNGTTSCIHFDSWGAQNIVKDNIPRGSGPEVTYNNPATLMPQNE